MKESYRAQNSLELKLPSGSFPPFYAKQRTLSPEEKKMGIKVDYAQLPASPSPWQISRIPCPSCLLLLLLLSCFSRVRLCATHRWQTTRLPRPWDSPGKNTGVGCHFLLQFRKVKGKSLSRFRLFATPWTGAYQAPPSMGFSKQEYWSGLPFPSPTHESKK